MSCLFNNSVVQRHRSALNPWPRTRPRLFPSDGGVTSLATQRMDQRWNVGQLGWDEHLNLDDVGKGYILHWNGEKKPWKRCVRLHPRAPRSVQLGG